MRWLVALLFSFLRFAFCFLLGVLLRLGFTLFGFLRLALCPLFRLLGFTLGTLLRFLLASARNGFGDDGSVGA